MNKALVIIPTYNEKAGLRAIMDAILKHESFDILVVDDASPDGTAKVVTEIMSREKRVSLIERQGKLGLGTAYVAGFKWGLQRGYQYLIEMDADGSHHPGALPWFLREIEGYGLVIGSRYLKKRISVVGWDFRRLLMSKFGNFYAAMILGIRLTDLTSGFRCYRREALEAIDLDRVHSSGYSFQIEMAYLVRMSGFKVHEMPIIFYDRSSGLSKMSGKIIREATVLPWMLRLRELRNAALKIFQGKTYEKEISH
ncbi:MAG: polyprenol monophosphomannose synthase [Candidatus Sulfobium sp.]|jgi:dolichol-phosphate mannosyltransferase